MPEQCEPETDATAQDGGPLPAHVEVAVVGTGFSGLGAAIGLLRAGRRDLVVLERAGTLGGTWRDNSYPGCACDVPSHLYSYSFAPNPDWSHSFSRQPEIQAYLQRTAREHGVLPFIRYGAELQQARWDDAAGRWVVQTARGTLTASVLVTATGPLSEPRLPDLPGLATFAGTAFHSAAWDHGHDLTGRRVAVVGTGASAVQFVPEIATTVARLLVLQRTPPWVLPRRDRRLGVREKALYRRLPAAQRLARGGVYWARELSVLGLEKDPRVLRLAERQATRWLAAQVPDAALRARLTPSYRLGCKRVLLSNTWYPALMLPQVDVVTDRLVEVVPEGLVTQDGQGLRTVHEVDTLVLGTGFRITDQPVAGRVVGRDGRTLAEHWSATGMQALHGTTVAGFPNYFHFVGPNTGLGHTSIVVMIEAQVGYLLDALRQRDALGLATLEPRRDRQDAWNAGLQERLRGTVWNTGGCASWYLDEAGRNTTLWPTFTFAFTRELAAFDLTAYDATPAAP